MLAQLCFGEARERLMEMAETDETSLGRARAMHALVELSHAGKLDGFDLVAYLTPFLDDPNWNVRNGAAIALHRLGDPRSLEPLRRARKRARYFTRAPLRMAIRHLKRRTRDAMG